MFVWVMEKYHSILFACLFGSYALGEVTAISDIAIFVEGKRGISSQEKLQFHWDGCRVLKKNDVDILVPNTTKNLFLLEYKIYTGKII